MSFSNHAGVKLLVELAEDCDEPSFIHECGDIYDVHGIKSMILEIVRSVSNPRVSYDTHELLKRFIFLSLIITSISYYYF